ncbi:hypothetical protein PFISCL1PPCAC_2329 [Pristionchus fissidentatus]|uniref:Uncharacterized protein n=1 Tax=Pristionchus fissidentatus TaxID=1538716 RepID=A0AAV5UUT6_9BILA|nr:hypothetical protein PFISCL1PPCAC_2329 [Pristionchus fissidentatus]
MVTPSMDPPPPFSEVQGNTGERTLSNPLCISINEIRALYDAREDRRMKENFLDYVNRLWWIVLFLWMHPLLVVVSLFFSFYFADGSRYANGREAVSLLISQTVSFLSIPFILVVIIGLIMERQFNLTFKPFARATMHCFGIIVTSFVCLTLTTLVTVDDLTKIPDDDTDIFYPDRSSECLTLWIHWVSSLILLISFLNIHSGLNQAREIKKFLNAIKWNGSYSTPKFNRNSVVQISIRQNLDAIDESMSERNTMFTIVYIGVLIYLSAMYIINLFSKQFSFLTLIDFISCCLIIASGCIMCYQLVKGRIMSTLSFILILIMVAFRLIFAHYSEIQDMAYWFRLSLIENRFSNEWPMPRFPLVEKLDPKSWKFEKLSSHINFTSDVAISCRDTILLFIGLSIIGHMISTFRTFNANQKKKHVMQSVML